MPEIANPVPLAAERSDIPVQEAASAPDAVMPAPIGSLPPLHVTSSSAPAIPPPPTEMYSPDGRFMWNGQNWLQVAPPPPQLAPAPSNYYAAAPSTAPQIVIQNTVNSNSGVRPMTTRSKGLAAVLAIFLGGLGIHKFYLGRGGMGVLYLLFCWTLIPVVLGLIDGIVLLAMDPRNFQFKYATYMG
jgi:TM2 domain-containing membrane protein YozV